MTSTTQNDTTAACTCTDWPDPSDLLMRAKTDRELFHWGLYLDGNGRQFVIEMLSRGYPEAVALRIAGRWFGVGS